MAIAVAIAGALVGCCMGDFTKSKAVSPIDVDVGAL